MHKLLFSAGYRNLRLRKERVLFVSECVQSRRKFSSLDVRLHLPECCVRLCRECRNDKVLSPSPSSRFRCLEETGDMLSGQMPCKEIDRNMRKFLLGGCLCICEHICRIVSLVESLTVVRKLSCRSALTKPFSKSVKVSWPKLKGKLKSIPIFFSHNLLFLCYLHHFR